MKKIIMVMMMVFGLSAVFAYEPKKECFEVYDTLAFYVEKVVVEDDIILREYLLDDNRSFQIRSSINLTDLKYEAEKEYLRLLFARTEVEQLTKKKKLYKRYKRDEMVEYCETCIECEINEAAYKIPFVTRENFYKISKRKYMKMFISYMETLKKQVNK